MHRPGIATGRWHSGCCRKDHIERSTPALEPDPCRPNPGQTSTRSDKRPLLASGCTLQAPEYQSAPHLPLTVLPLDLTDPCRPLAPGDLAQMQALHSAMFPLDYEDTFYQTAVRGLDNIFTWAAFTRCARGVGPLCTGQ